MEEPSQPVREGLVELLVTAFERAAERLRAQDHEHPWPEDLTAEEIVRLLQNRAREVVARAYQEEDANL